MSEKLIPITSEGELRIGMLVVVTLCNACGRSHRFMLLRPLLLRCSRCTTLVSGWSHTNVKCKGGTSDNQGILHHAIPEGRIFRVDDGLDELKDLVLENEEIGVNIRSFGKRVDEIIDRWHAGG